MSLSASKTGYMQILTVVHIIYAYKLIIAASYIYIAASYIYIYLANFDHGQMVHLKQP